MDNTLQDKNGHELNVGDWVWFRTGIFEDGDRIIGQIISVYKDRQF